MVNELTLTYNIVTKNGTDFVRKRKVVNVVCFIIHNHDVLETCFVLIWCHINQLVYNYSRTLSKIQKHAHEHIH